MFFKRFFKNLSVTNWLILINIVFFISFYIFIIITKQENAVDYAAIKPIFIMQGKYLWAIITNMFMHGNFLHLFINMFVLFSLGNLCEKIIGRKRFLAFYLASGIVAGLVFVFLAYFFGNTSIGLRLFGSSEISAVGASGAIFAIAGLLMIITPKLKFTIIFFPFFSLPAYIMIPLVLFGVWIITFLANAQIIGNAAHFGGFLAGVVFGLYLKHKYKKKVKLIEKYFR